MPRDLRTIERKLNRLAADHRELGEDLEDLRRDVDALKNAKDDEGDDDE